MNTFTTQGLALAQPITEREGDILCRWTDDAGVRTYQWLTALDVEELELYGYDDFVIVIDNA